MTIPSEFFSTTAQVLPVMAITLIVEQRIFLPTVATEAEQALPLTQRRALLAVLGGLTATVIGESFALGALVWGGEVLHLAVILASLAGLSLIMVAPIFELLRRTKPPTSVGARRVVMGTKVLTTLASGVIFFLLLLLTRR